MTDRVPKPKRADGMTPQKMTALVSGAAIVTFGCWLLGEPFTFVAAMFGLLVLMLAIGWVVFRD